MKPTDVIRRLKRQFALQLVVLALTACLIVVALLQLAGWKP